MNAMRNPLEMGNMISLNIVDRNRLKLAKHNIILKIAMSPIISPEKMST